VSSATYLDRTRTQTRVLFPEPAEEEKDLSLRGLKSVCEGNTQRERNEELEEEEEKRREYEGKKNHPGLELTKVFSVRPIFSAMFP
jgi:hypothetical protein